MTFEPAPPAPDPVGAVPSLLRATRVAVAAAYGAQALGFAVLVTSLPAIGAEQRLDGELVSLILLGVCLTAALGSVAANLIAVRWGSRRALVLGLVIEAASLPLLAVPTSLTVLFSTLALYGGGLGCVDASVSMQGVTVQRAYGRPLLGRFFATYTAAAIIGGLLVSAVVVTSATAGIAVVVAAAVILAVAIVGLRQFAREVPVDEALPRAERGRLPRAGIWAFGLVIFAVFVVDSAVSTWGTVYLQDVLQALAWVAPLGFVTYQVCVMVTNLATERLLPVVGRARLVAAAVVISGIGCLVLALLPSVSAAFVGFALAGFAVGMVVPVTYGAAGDLSPVHSDQIVARINIFNYLGIVVGAVALGFLAEGPGLGPAFLLPAAALVASLLLVPWFRRGSVA